MSASAWTMRRWSPFSRKWSSSARNPWCSSRRATARTWSTRKRRRSSCSRPTCPPSSATPRSTPSSPTPSPRPARAASRTWERSWPRSSRRRRAGPIWARWAPRSKPSSAVDRARSMTGRIPQPFIDEVVARSDIVEVIGARVALKKSGREYKACCPFHAEKSPSFWVSPEKQFYHCFGCGAHGTVVGFLMQYEKLGFLDAVADLAQRAGLELPREAQGSDSTGGPDLHEVMERASRFFEQNLADSARAQKYLSGRGIDAAAGAKFSLGYAPDSWNALLNRFGAQEDERRRLLQTGLIIERDTRGGERTAGYYDRFRDRLMFPIRDSRGRVIGFGGRIIDQGEPKYLNSPETPLFHKGRELYGLYEARQARADF